MLNDILGKHDSTNWNEITQGIDHISGKHITLSTNPSMKVNIDGKVNLETSIEIQVLPKTTQLLTATE